MNSGTAVAQRVERGKTLDYFSCLQGRRSSEVLHTPCLVGVFAA
jgi:hypothetical protein